MLGALVTPKDRLKYFGHKYEAITILKAMNQGIKE
jgi:hypothetical protein